MEIVFFKMSNSHFSYRSLIAELTTGAVIFYPVLVTIQIKGDKLG